MPAAPAVLLNSTNVISGYTSLLGTAYAGLTATGVRWFGNISTPVSIGNCLSAALAMRSLIVSSSTRGQQVYFPEGGNPQTTDTLWTGTVTANAPGVLAWARANNNITDSGTLGSAATLASVLALASTPGSWPAGGMVDAAGAHHLLGTYGQIDWQNKSAVKLALQNFKAIFIVLNGTTLVTASTSGSTTVGARDRCVYGQAAANGTNHCFIVCDYGTAAQLATQYGITLPSGLATDTFCLGGLSWGKFVILDWQSWLNLGSYAYVVTTDADRGDAATFNAQAPAIYAGITGASGISPIALGPFVSTSFARVTSGTPDLAGYINGVAQGLTGLIGAVDSLGYAKYTPSAADVANLGQLVIDAALTGAAPFCWQKQLTSQSIGNGNALQSTVRTTPATGAKQFTTDLLYATASSNGLLTSLVGQVVTFTSGTAIGKSYLVNGYSNASSYLSLSLASGMSPAPTATNTFVLSNVATANALATQIATLPVLGQIIDQVSGDGSAIQTAAGILASPNTDRYWYKTGADAHWNTVAGNWWTSAAHNVQSVLPVAGDSVYLTGSTIPDTVPSAITLARFDTSLLAANLTGTTTSSITIAPKGVAVIGSAANPSYEHRWWGSAAADASISFCGASSNMTTIVGDAEFYGTSHNGSLAVVKGDATFHDSSYNLYLVEGNAKFYDTSYNPSVVLGSAKFYDNSYTENNVGPYSVWYDASYAKYNVAAGNVSVGDNWRWYSSMPRYLHVDEPFAWVWGANGYEQSLAWQAAAAAAIGPAIPTPNIINVTSETTIINSES